MRLNLNNKYDLLETIYMQANENIIFNLLSHFNGIILFYTDECCLLDECE